MGMKKMDSKDNGRRPELQAFAERIRQVRDELEMNREDFAASLGVSGGAVGNWEAGANTIAGTSLARLVEEHGVNPDWISNWTRGNVDDNSKGQSGGAGGRNRDAAGLYD